MRTQKREIQIILVPYLLIKNFIPSVKNYTFRGIFMELEVFFAIIQEILPKIYRYEGFFLRKIQ
jgi:hypothetical protein